MSIVSCLVPLNYQTLGFIMMLNCIGYLERLNQKAWLLTTTLVIFSPFLFPPKKRGKKKRRMNSKNSDQKSLHSARSPWIITGWTLNTISNWMVKFSERHRSENLQKIFHFLFQFVYHCQKWFHNHACFVFLIVLIDQKLYELNIFF